MRKIRVSEETISKIVKFVENVLFRGEKPERYIIKGLEGNWVGISGWRDVTERGFEKWIFHINASFEFKNTSNVIKLVSEGVFSITGCSSATASYVRHGHAVYMKIVRVECVWYVNRPLSVYLEEISYEKHHKTV